MSRSWLGRVWEKNALIFLVVPVSCGLVAALLAYSQLWSSLDWSANPYVHYDKSITARIGAYAPYAMIDKSGTLDGFVIDLTHAISRVMSVRIVMLSSRLDDPLDLAAMRDADVVLCMVKTPASERLYDFTRPYAIHSFAVFGRKNSPKFRDYRKALDDGAFVFNSDGIYYDLHLSRAKHHACGLAATADEAIREVARGEYDYTILETYIGNALIEMQALHNMVLIEEIPETVEYSFAVRKGSTELLKVFSEGLDYLQSTGQFDKIQKRWVEKRFMLTKSVRDAIILYGAIGLGVCLSLMLAFFLWSHILGRQVRARTAALEAEIQERRKTEAKLLLSQAQLIQADKMAAVGTLAASVAHEINNPNGLILLNLAMFRQVYECAQEALQAQCERQGELWMDGIPWSSLREQMPQILDDTMQASLRIKGIVEDLKDFARPDSADWNEDFDLNAVVRASLRLQESLIRKTTDHLRVDYASDLPLVHGSAQKIEQVVLNLVINACQALRERSNGIFIATSLDPLRRAVRFTIRDEGCGIDPADLPRLFDPFFTTKRGQGGTGLGLSISDTIIKAHRGSLTVCSDPGKGTTVVMSLPT